MRHSILCTVTWHSHNVRVTYTGPEEIRKPLVRSLENLAEGRRLEVDSGPLPEWDERGDWHCTFRTSHAVRVVADSLLEIFDDGFDWNIEDGWHTFSFWCLEEKAGEGRRA